MITNIDLQRKISKQQLQELSDIQHTGQFNQDTIDDAINDAISFMESYIILPMNTTSLLKRILVHETIYELRLKNKILTPKNKEQRKKNVMKLHNISIGKLS